jgi:hypothetical protein
MNSASLCSLAGRYDNPIPPRFLAPTDFLKIPAPVFADVPQRHLYKTLQMYRGALFTIQISADVPRHPLYCTYLLSADEPHALVTKLISADVPHALFTKLISADVPRRPLYIHNFCRCAQCPLY